LSSWCTLAFTATVSSASSAVVVSNPVDVFSAFPSFVSGISSRVKILCRAFCFCLTYVARAMP
jgi:hypothetical protein